MTYLENAYVCLAAPLLVAILCLKGTWRRALAFLLTGMTCCVLAAYISTFWANALQLATIPASTAANLSISFISVIVLKDSVVRPVVKHLVYDAFGILENIVCNDSALLHRDDVGVEEAAVGL